MTASHRILDPSFVIALVLGCTAAPRGPVVPLGSPAGLSPGEVTLRCRLEERPRRADVVTSEWERARVCSPVELTGDATCEWACTVYQGGWCGNGGSWDLLVLLRERGGSFERLGSIPLADHGPGSLGFRRTVWLERRALRTTIVARLVVPRHRSIHGWTPARERIERYVVVGWELRRATAFLP